MSTMSQFPGFLTTAEVAGILHRDPATICRYVRRKHLKARRAGRTILIPEQELDGFVPPPAGNPKFRVKLRPTRLMGWVGRGIDLA
jgi:excisionase family DNA binding protein